MRVPYREITLSPTRHSDHTEDNPPVQVYDTSGPYTDADVQIDLSRGLLELRADWIAQRDDTEILATPSSEYARERDRDRDRERDKERDRDRDRERDRDRILAELSQREFGAGDTA